LAGKNSIWKLVLRRGSRVEVSVINAVRLETRISPDDADQAGISAGIGYCGEVRGSSACEVYSGSDKSCPIQRVLLTMTKPVTDVRPGASIGNMVDIADREILASQLTPTSGKLGTVFTNYGTTIRRSVVSLWQ
jgi:hypothetical protein